MFSTLSRRASHWAQGNNGSCTGIHWQSQGIFHCICQFFDVIFRICSLSECCMIRQGPLRGNFDFFAASGESTAWVLLWKTRSRPIAVTVCPVAQFNFFNTTFDSRAWTLVLFWRESLGRQLQLITPENGRDEISSHHHQNLLSLMLLMFLVVRILVDLLNSLVDSFLIRQISPDFQQDCLQLLHLLVAREERDRSRPRSPLPEPQLIPIPMMAMMISNHTMEDNGNGWDRLIEPILTHRCRTYR